MKIIKVNAYEFNELNQKAKNEVVNWLDQHPLDYETEDEQGNIIKEYQYFYDMEEIDIIEHCEMNEYLFNKYGEPIHHLEIKE
tara:strand:+ start:1332 stop:1580 length:249 start_codon:yes stop_codon:yes gene_type:complete